MSQATALPRAQELKTALHDWGVAQVSIELQAGRPISGVDQWDNRLMFCTFGHHTAIPKSYRDAGKMTPSLAICKTGRSDVPGPLCQGYLGFDRVARILTLGPANHPGEGGPLTLSGRTIPLNGARPYAFGWEMEGGDYDWLDWQHDLMARCLGATQQFLGAPPEAHAEHRTWTSRKIDRFTYTQASAIEAIRAIDRDETDMPLTEDDVQRVAWAVWSIISNSSGGHAAHSQLTTAARAASDVMSYPLPASDNAHFHSVISDLYKRVQDIQAQLDDTPPPPVA